MPGSRLLCATLTALFAVAPSVAQSAPSQDLVAVYKDLHQHPELSHHEERTSAILATALRAAGYNVTDHVGVYPDGSRAFGVVGIRKTVPALLCWFVPIWTLCPLWRRPAYRTPRTL